MSGTRGQAALDSCIRRLFSSTREASWAGAPQAPPRRTCTMVSRVAFFRNFLVGRPAPRRVCSHGLVCGIAARLIRRTMPSALILLLASHGTFSAQRATAAVAAGAGCCHRSAFEFGVASARGRDVACAEADPNDTPFGIIEAPSSVDWQPAHAVEPAGAPFRSPTRIAAARERCCMCRARCCHSHAASASAHAVRCML